MTTQQKERYIYELAEQACPRSNQMKKKRATDILEQITEKEFDLLHSSNPLKLNNLILVLYCLRRNADWEVQLIKSLVNYSKPAIFDSYFRKEYDKPAKKTGIARGRGRPRKIKPTKI